MQWFVMRFNYWQLSLSFSPALKVHSPKEVAGFVTKPGIFFSQLHSCYCKPLWKECTTHSQKGNSLVWKLLSWKFCKPGNREVQPFILWISGHPLSVISNRHNSLPIGEPMQRYSAFMVWSFGRIIFVIGNILVWPKSRVSKESDFSTYPGKCSSLIGGRIVILKYFRLGSDDKMASKASGWRTSWVRKCTFRYSRLRRLPISFAVV